MRKSISFLLTLVMIVTMLFIPVTSKQANAASDKGVRDFVTRMYKVCLDRKPDKDGLDNWTKLLVNHEQTGVSAAYGFVFSKEFQSKNCSNEEYVKYMYSAFFGRKPDTAGLNFWVDYLKKGNSREKVFCGFANSVEFGTLCSKYGIVRGYHIAGQDFEKVAKVNLFVERLYNVVLDRECDNAGMEDWTTKLVTRQKSGCEVAYGFVFSKEFIDKNYCNDCYVETLYMAFMGRNSDSAGKAGWVKQLKNGASREKVFNGFAGSQEFIGICKSYGINAGSINISGSGTRAKGKCSNCGAINPTPTPTPKPTTAPKDFTWTYKGCTLTFPASWKNRIVIKDDTVYCKKCYDYEYGDGALFYLYAKRPEELNNMQADYLYILGMANGKVIIAASPTGACFDVFNETLLEEYNSLYDDLEGIYNKAKCTGSPNMKPVYLSSYNIGFDDIGVSGTWIGDYLLGQWSPQVVFNGYTGEFCYYDSLDSNVKGSFWYVERASGGPHGIVFIGEDIYSFTINYSSNTLTFKRLAGDQFDLANYTYDYWSSSTNMTLDEWFY